MVYYRPLINFLRSQTRKLVKFIWRYEKSLTKRATITNGREGKTGFRTKMQKLHHVFISFLVRKTCH